MNKDIVIVGDVHGGFGRLNAMMNKRRPKIVIQTGDLGFWPRSKEQRKGVYDDGPTIKVPEGSKLYWCDGNHEDHYELDVRTTDELWPRTQYMPRGSTTTLPDGRVVLFLGGALCIDRHHRVEGSGEYGWFRNEQLSDHDVLSIDDDLKVDIVVSHTCPMEFDIPMRYEYVDSSRTDLSYILHKFKPKQWFFGHWHICSSGNYLGCEWTGLGCFHPSSTNSWVYLEDM